MRGAVQFRGSISDMCLSSPGLLKHAGRDDLTSKIIFVKMFVEDGLVEMTKLSKGKFWSKH